MIKTNLQRPQNIPRKHGLPTATLLAKPHRFLVELAPQTGQVRQVALTTPEDIAARSAEALDNAMDAIRHMARRVVDTVTPLQIAPSSVEIEFGLKLTAEGNAIITKATIEGNLKVKMTWDLKK